jgi:hypothetical protein
MSGMFFMVNYTAINPSVQNAIRLTFSPVRQAIAFPIAR